MEGCVREVFGEHTVLWRMKKEKKRNKLKRNAKLISVEAFQSYFSDNSPRHGEEIEIEMRKTKFDNHLKILA